MARILLGVIHEKRLAASHARRPVAPPTAAAALVAPIAHCTHMPAAYRGQARTARRQRSSGRVDHAAVAEGSRPMSWMRRVVEHHGCVLTTTAGRLTAALTAALIVGVCVGLAVLWPAGGSTPAGPLASGQIQPAEVVAVTRGSCENWGGPGCKLLEIELGEGQHAGQRSYITLGGDHGTPPVHAGDRITVLRNAPAGIDSALADQLPIDDPSQQPYSFIDFDRTSPLLFLVIGFAGLVIVLGRWHGLRALLGLGLSLLLVVEFVAPAILAGSSPLLIALIGSLAVMVVTIGVSHGIGVKSCAAMLGTAAALLLTALLALFVVRAANITGFSSEEATLLFAGTGTISLEGLVLAGMVIGALGVLDDVTVSQASTVMALRRANPALSVRRLFAEALAVGRDHLGATVNTLVLAYAGAALPILLIFNTNGTSFKNAVNGEPVAEQIVAMLVGSIGLIAAVPLTTAIAALVAGRIPASAVPEGLHHHHH